MENFVSKTEFDLIFNINPFNNLLITLPRHCRMDSGYQLHKKECIKHEEKLIIFFTFFLLITHIVFHI